MGYWIPGRLTENVPCFQTQEALEMQNVFAVCLLAELVPATVQDYREKLLHLRKLRHDLVQPTLPLGTFQEVLNPPPASAGLLGCMGILFSHPWQRVYRVTCCFGDKEWTPCCHSHKCVPFSAVDLNSHSLHPLR